MSKFSDSAGNDSFDDILATFEEPTKVPAKPNVPSDAKKPKLFDDGDDGMSDSILANIDMPASSISSKQTEKPANGPVSSGKTNCVLVSPKQRGNSQKEWDKKMFIFKKSPFLSSLLLFSGNPILKSITNVPWEFDESIIPDYVVGKTAAILFLSLRYHSLNPDYIHNRLKELGKRFELRVLLVQVDTKVRPRFQIDDFIKLFILHFMT